MSMEKYKSLQKLSASELKKKCQDASLKNTGTKHEMVLRLCGFEDPNRMSFKAVNEWLKNQGVTNVKGVSKCLRAGIQNGFIKINGDDPLNNVVISDKCCLCDHQITATIRDLLYQPDYGGHDYEDGSISATIKCPNEDCEIVGVYVTGMCSGSVEIDCGKSHNHCTVCPDFGRCTGDYRQKHCRDCGDHFFGRFPCHCKEVVYDESFEGLMAYLNS